MEEKENLIDNQENDNNKINNDEKLPLKKKESEIIFQSVIMNINKTLSGENNKEDNNKGDDNKEDNNNENEKEEYPIKLVLEGKKDSITIIKSKLQAPWVHHFKENKYGLVIKTLFYIVLPFLASINLIGIFQIISIMNALFKVLSNEFWSYIGLEDKEDELYNFYSFYIKESINEGIEFDLIETMSFLGMIFYEFYGYKISSLLFMIPNSLSFF